MLNILKKNKVHVTFFMTGGWIETYPEDVKAIYKAGHELGNHSENHKQMSESIFQQNIGGENKCLSSLQKNARKKS